MSYDRYLWIVAEELQRTIAPELQSGRARTILLACVRTLARVAGAVGESPAPSALLANLPALAPELESHLAALRDEPAPQRDGLLLETAGPPEDVIARGTLTTALRGLSSALEDGAWLRDAALRDSVAALVDWECGLHADVDARVARVEAITGDGADADSVITLSRERLEAYLQQRFADHDGVRLSEFRQVAGGRSKQTALFTLEGVPELPRKLALRRDHPMNLAQGKSAVNEFGVLAVAREHGVTVPQPFIREPDRHWLGAPFIIVEQMPGSVAGEYWTPPRDARLARALAVELARIHTIPVDAPGLTFPAEPTLTSAAPDAWHQDLANLRATYNRLASGPSPVVAAAFGWMQQHVDAIDHRVTIVHADPHFHNIHHDGNGRLLALLDWELAHLGHPGEDLGYARPVIERALPWAEFMQAYRAAGGPEVTQVQVDWFTLRELIRLITMLQYPRGLLESGQLDDVLITEIGTDFINRLVRRLAEALRSILQPA